MSRLAAALPQELGHLLDIPALMNRLDIEGHYSAMVPKQEREVQDFRKSEGMQLPLDLPYHTWASAHYKVPIDTKSRS